MKAHNRNFFVWIAHQVFISLIVSGYLAAVPWPKNGHVMWPNSCIANTLEFQALVSLWGFASDLDNWNLHLDLPFNSCPPRMWSSYCQFHICPRNMGRKCFVSLFHLIQAAFCSVHFLGPVQTSNFSCVESNANEKSLLFSLICIRFGTWKARRLNRALDNINLGCFLVGCRCQGTRFTPCKLDCSGEDINFLDVLKSSIGRFLSPKKAEGSLEKFEKEKEKSNIRSFQLWF